jgi:hypothetical protein
VRIIVIEPGVEVSVESWFGIRREKFGRIVDGGWVSDSGRRAGPDLVNQFDLLSERETVFADLRVMQSERRLSSGGTDE